MSKKKQTVAVYVAGQKKAEQMAVPSFLSAELVPALVAQIVHTEQKRRRIRRAHTKSRGEVRGGGRKPWKQKGTGRARHGSIRSPLWVGGGKSFGPKTRHEVITTSPTKMRRRALASALKWHATHGTLALARFSKYLPVKTGQLADLFTTSLAEAVQATLVILAPSHISLRRPLRNLKNITATGVEQVSVLDIVRAARVVIDEECLTNLEKRVQ